MMSIRSSKGLAALLVLVLMGLRFETSHAATIDLQVATEYAIDPSTGIKTPFMLNPSGTADLSYINNGIVLSFAGRDGKQQTIKVHLDFEFLLNSDPGSRAMAVAVYDKIKEAGPSATGNAIAQSAERAKVEGKILTLMVEAYRNPGFYKTDFDLAQIRMVTNSGVNVRLQNLVAAAFMPQQDSTSATNASENANDKVTDAVATKTCEGQFISVL